jgi:hypothetical protein
LVSGGQASEVTPPATAALSSGSMPPRRAGEIDQTGAGDQPAGVDLRVRREAGRRLADGRDAAVGNEQVEVGIETVFRVDQAGVPDVQVLLFIAQFPARIPMTAMRTAIPKVTCGRITACGPSATSESISTPRFIGPGCITMASGLASASIAGVSP